MAKDKMYGKTLRKNFARHEEIMEMPNLLELQKKSYRWFLDEGLQEVFTDVASITNYAGNLELSFIGYKMDEAPKYDVEECKARDATYAAPLKVNVRLYNNQTQEIKEQEIFMGDFPLMTQSGTFVINGAERVVVSQIVRSPGVYYGKEIDLKTDLPLLTSTVIPYRGAWLEYETDTNEVFWVRIDKIPITELIRAIGGQAEQYADLKTDTGILDLFGDDDRIKVSLEKDACKTYEEAMLEIYRKLRPGEPPTVEASEGLIKNLFFDPRRYDLSRVGRYKFNKKLSLWTRIHGQKLAYPVADPRTGEILFDAGHVMTSDEARELDAIGVNDVTLDLDGKALTLTASEGSVIQVSSGAHLTIRDSSPDSDHHENGRHGGQIRGGKGSKIIDSYGNEVLSGGGICVMERSTLTMMGGSIDSCTATYGGGVYVGLGGKLEIENGSILYCEAVYGGGVYVAPAGVAELKNSSMIKNCKAEGSGDVYGGGVYVVSRGNPAAYGEGDGEKIEYHLTKFSRSNQSNCYNQRPIVFKGNHVEAGQVIADGPSTSEGELALGKNPLIGFMTWEGYNYEDAVLLSERLVMDDVYTSVHIEEYEAEARDTKLGPEEITRDVPGVGDEALKDLDDRGIIRVGAEVRAGDILVGKVTPKGETELTAEERLLRAIFGEKAREVRDTSLKVPHGEYGIIVDAKVFTRENGDELSPGVNQAVRIYIAQKRKISVGDKMAGRHGNKGVVSRVLPVEDMPYLPNGRPLDIVLNPLGVPSRMNIGQVLEIHLSLAAKALGFNVATPIFNGANEKDIQDTLELANDYVNLEWDEFKEKHGEELLPEVLDYLYENRDHRKLWKGVPISKEGKVRLRDGRTGEEFDSMVTIGHMHYLKLHHLVDDKIHARSTGPYSLVTQQPLGGKAQFGGQRFGEMEVWALEAYGASYTLQEILTVKSDDVVGRVKTYEAIIKGDNIPEPGIPESFKVLLKELQSLGLDVRVLREDNTEVEIMETVDYSDTDYRYEMEGDSKGYNYNEEENLGKMGYQKQEFDSEKQELVNADDDYTEDAADDGFEESFDEE